MIQSTMSGNEAASGGLSLTLVPDNILKNLMHGYLFLESGDLISAESDLFRVQTALESSEKYEDVRCCIASQTDIAICKLRRGMYKEAQEDFNAVLHKKITVHERNTVERWIAISLLYQGHYEEATECFKSILETIHTKGLDHIITEILVRRNLALSFAYQGIYQQALSQIKTARDRLEQAQAQLNKMLPRRLSQLSEPDRTVSIESSETLATQISAGDKEMDVPNLDPIPHYGMMQNEFNRLCLAESKIYYMLGDFKAALEKSGEALRGMENKLGAGHIETLECASHHSLVLAFNSRVSEAKSMEKSTFPKTRRRLGPLHPQTLETLGHLVKIYQFQARLSDAGDTAKSLARDTESSLTARHLQTYHCRYLEAESMLAFGNYDSAEVKLEGIVKDAVEVYGKCHPTIIHYHSRLAFAKYHSGKLQEAWRLIVPVFKEQSKMYTFYEQTAGEAYDAPRFDGHQPPVDLQDVHNYLQDKTSKNQRIHPYILQTLRTITLIKLQVKGSEDYAFLVFWAIWKQNELYWGKSSIFTLDSEYDFAIACKGRGISLENDDLLQQAANHLRLVYQGRFSLLHPTHPGTISARRELLIVNITLGQWESHIDPNRTINAYDVTEKVSPVCLDSTKWRCLEAESRDLVGQHEACLGFKHPETLQSLELLFIVQIMLENTAGARETLHEGLQRLRHISVRHERFIKSLAQEHRFALILIGRSDTYDMEALQILREILWTTEALPKTKRDTLHKSIEFYKAMIDNDIETLSSKFRPCRERWEKELEAKIKSAEAKELYHEAATYQAELWSLLASLDKLDSTSVIDARIKLAEFQIRRPTYHKKKEGRQLLREVTATYSKALTQDQRQRIEALEA